MFAGKPVIGLAGGIGSGKSRVAGFFAELGCLVLDADAQVRELYQEPEVKNTLREWWGQEVFNPAGEVDRSAVGRKIFADPGQRKRLEEFLHPRVGRLRDQAMRAAVGAGETDIVAFVWDIPLLFENGLDRECDAVVFVDCPAQERRRRVEADRGWTAAQLAQRENLQMPLDKKREMSDHVLSNTADAAYARSQVKEILSRILADLPGGPHEG
jgi:dephospho-CoA kinase